MAGPCPFGKGNQDLSQRILTTEEKLWLGKSINLKLRTSITLAQKYNLKEERIREWARRISKGLTPNSKGGRPARLTEDDKKQYAEAVRSAGGQLSAEESVAILNEMANKNDAKRQDISLFPVRGISYSSISSLNRALGMTTLVTTSDNQSTKKRKNTSLICTTKDEIDLFAEEYTHCLEASVSSFKNQRKTSKQRVRVLQQQEEEVVDETCNHAAIVNTPSVATTFIPSLSCDKQVRRTKQKTIQIQHDLIPLSSYHDRSGATAVPMLV